VATRDSARGFARDVLGVDCEKVEHRSMIRSNSNAAIISTRCCRRAVTVIDSERYTYMLLAGHCVKAMKTA
jgi:hypothetical protein